ncbi:MAG: hypothetical protein H0V49_09220, partial [Nocardioidaceae bacterium]|nr:hypothetical protein [Nocardioidaceae bacterium]
MSRADAYDAYFHESRVRLLPQVYAYAGNTEVASRALADAFTAAGQHWHKLSEIPDAASTYKDAWIRQRAFDASERRQQRRTPWYVTARQTADENRPLLLALGALQPQVRKLVILSSLAAVDLPTAAREVGVTDGAATGALQDAAATLRSRGIDTSPTALTGALERLSHDVRDQPVDRPSRLRREGDRRRRSHMLLAAVTSLALAVGAGALTAAQVADPIVQPERLAPQPRETPPAPRPELTPEQLASTAVATMLDESRRWRLADSSRDFAVTEPIDECVSSMPSSPRARHLWVRTFASGGARPTQATQMLEVAPSRQAARLAHLRLVKQFAGCAVGGHQLVAFRSVDGVGDRANLLTLRHVDEDGLHDERVALARSGRALVTWVARGTAANPVDPSDLVRVLGRSVDSVCRLAQGACSAKSTRLRDQVPPPEDSARGFLTTLDMPLFEGVTRPWVATPPREFMANPAATQCDQANFAAAGAEPVSSRSLVVPGARL